VATGGQIISGRHVLTLPPGAVHQNVDVTVIDLTDQLGYPAARILPEGLQFRRKGTLVTTVSDLLDPTMSEMYRVFNSHAHNGGVWTPLNAALTPDGSGLSVSPVASGLHAVNILHTQ
jgi:hypothetical protein